VADEDEERLSQQETVAAWMTRVPAADDATPQTRLGGGTAIAASQLERMMRSLRPLPVNREGDDSEDLVVVGRLGEGGMAVVELAKQRSLDREVALKRLKDDPDDAGSMGHGLLDEARITGSLEHPNIVPIHAVGVDDVLGPVVVLKRVQGEVWSDALKRDADALPNDDVALDRHLRVLMQVCNALHYAHSRGVVHRDVKPDNVMLGEYGEVYLMDWGIALKPERPPEAFAVAGTAAYMAPEMVLGELDRHDGRTDVYLLGATLHEILTGRPRHLASTLPASLLSALQSEPVEWPPEVPPDLGAIANRACNADPALRFQSAAAFRDAIEDFMEQREARLLVRVASDLLDEVEESDRVGGDSTETAVKQHAETTRRFHEVRFALQQALRVRPEYLPAERVRRRLLLAMIRHALFAEDVTGALALAEELGEPLPPALDQLIEATRNRLRAQKAHVEHLRKEADVLRGNQIRTRFIGAFGVFLAIRHAVSLAIDPGPGYDIDPRKMLVGLGVLAAVFMALLVASRKRFRHTRADRQFFRMAMGLLLAMPMVVLIGVHADLKQPTILALGLGLISTVLLVVDAPFRLGPYLALIGMAGATLGGVFPDVARYLFMAWTMTTVIAVYFDLRNEPAREARKQRARGTDLEREVDPPS